MSWDTKRLGDLAAPDGGAIAIGPFGSSMKSDVYVANGVPVVRGTNLDGRPGFRGDFVFVEDETAERFGRCLVMPGDLVFPHRGAIGSVGLAIDESPGKWLLSTSMMKFRADRERLDPGFAFYFFNSDRGRHELLKNASQVGTPGIGQPLTSLRACEIPVPANIDEQRTIAGVLGALDEKVAHNRLTAQALERLARAIFRAWFVDFEPVKAKADGATSFPSMPQAVFDALPTCFGESRIGPVPDGWDVGTLEGLLSARKERINPSEDTLRLPYVPIECITAKRVTLEESKDGSEAQSSLIRFVTGDILFGAMRPYFHKVCLAPFDGTTRTTCFVLSPRREKDRAFSLLLASEASTVEYATNHSVGSTIPYAKWENSLAEMPCIIPPVTCREAFADLIDSPLQLCQQLVRESHKLTRMRDYLLPRLLSGDVRVDVQTMELPG